MKKLFVLSPTVVAAAVCVLFASSALAALPELVDLADKVGGSVVNIKAEVTAASAKGPGGKWKSAPEQRRMEEFFDQFEQFFGRRGPGMKSMPDKRAPRRRGGVGSGFIISEDGYILTNNHVVEGADKITVNLKSGGKNYKAKVIGQDPDTDLALIKIKPETKLPALRFGDSEAARVGQWVVAIGNPFGLEHTVTSGIISAKGRVIGAGPYDDFIQTDASINPGNSGGPLVNLDGEVVGVNTAIIASGQGIGFAIPSEIAKDVVAELKRNGSVKRGLLGVNIQDVDENTAKALGLNEAKGALVAQVSPNGPAEKAGFEVGDVVLEVNGEDVEGSRELTRMIGAMRPGEKVKVEVFRKGGSKTLSAKLATRDPKHLAEADIPTQKDEALGMALRPLEKRKPRPWGSKKRKACLSRMWPRTPRPWKAASGPAT